MMPSPPGAVSDLPIGASILIVDDHPANLLALEAILEPLGQRIVRASSGEEALKRILNEEFAVILMDVQMPGLDGLQTAALIKEREKSRHVPIIFLTAISKEASWIFKGYAQGAVDYLLKPVDPEILRSKVSVFVELFVKNELLKLHEANLRRREVESLQRANELRFRALTDAIPNCVWASNGDGDIYFCNRAWFEYSGLSLEQTKDGGFLDAAHPDDRARVRQTSTQGVLRRTPFELEYRIRRHDDGSYRWFLVRVVPERNERGDVIGWIGTGTDIDDHKRDEQALAQFKSTLDATLDCVFIFEPDDLLLSYVNEGAVRQLGHSRDELLGKTVLEIEPELSEGPFRATLSRLVAGGAPSHTYTTTHHPKDGAAVPVEVAVQYIAGGGGPGRFVAIVRDISERTRIELALRRANEAKDSFLAAASHELRTPLAAAKAQTQLALRKLPAEIAPTVGRFLTLIIAQIDRMTKLVEELLDISRIESGRLSLEIVSFDVVALLGDICERIRVLSSTHAIELLADESLEIEGDRDRIDQVVTNLLTNAIRYSPGGGQITVVVRGDETSVHLTVTDQGVGVPKEKQAEIFERFARAHGSKYGGLGLGLTIAHGIVQQHGGTLWVESSGVAGEGSAFHVRLPRRAREQRTSLSPPALG